MPRLEPGSKRAHLARATAEVHQALHGALPFRLIEQGRLELGGYGALLAILHRYHGAMSDACEAGAQALDAPDLARAHRRRIARLEKDLSFLKVSYGESLCAPRREAGFSVGCLYTVLGSTLGGKVISRQLEDLLADGQGRSFFAGGPDDAASWRLFCQRLEDCPHPLAALEAGASHAFAHFAGLLGTWRNVPARHHPTAAQTVIG